MYGTNHDVVHVWLSGITLYSILAHPAPVPSLHVKVTVLDPVKHADPLGSIVVIGAVVS